MDVQQFADWVKEGIISPPQMATLITLETTTNDKSLRNGIEALLPVRQAQPDLFRSTVDALFDAHGKEGGKKEEKPKQEKAENKTEEENQKKEQEKKKNEVRELVMICVDVSGSMGAPFESERNRLEAVKQMFYGFRDQTASYEYGYAHRLGLISYNSKIVVHEYPTADFDGFEAVIDNMKQGGSTAIFDAIHKACEVLKPLTVKYPDADYRVICLSDGQNNASVKTAKYAAEQLQSLQATCDAIIVGDQPDNALLRIVDCTHGQCFQITSLSGGYETLESLSVVSLFERRQGEPKGIYEIKPFSQAAAVEMQKGAQVVQPVVPAAPVQSVSAAIQQTSQSAAGGSASQKRILKELSSFNAPGFHIFPGGTNGIQFANVLMEGKPGSIYEGGVFEIRFNFPSDYPFKPPKVRFVTPIYHYAIGNDGGFGCLPILHDSWSPAQTLTKLCESVSELIHSPETVDPSCDYSMRSWLSELFRVNKADYEKNAREATKGDASASVEDYKKKHNIP